MTTYLLSAAKIYLDSYTGLSRKSWQGILLSFISAVIIDIYYFLPLYFVDVLHLGIAASGLIMACYGIGTICGGYAGGKLSDKISPNTVTAVALLIQACAFTLLTQTKSVHLLMLNLFIVGTASYAFITANYAWVLSHSDSNEQSRLRALNILNTAANLGFAISSGIIMYFVLSEFELVIKIAVCVLCLLAIIAWFLDKPRTISVAQITDTPTGNKDVVYLDTGRNKIVWLTLACVFFMGLIIAQLNTTYSIFINERFPEYGARGVGMLFMLNAAMVVLFQTPVVDVLSRYNKILLVGIGAFLIGTGMLMLNFSYEYVFALVACLVYTLGEMIFFSVAQYICYQNAGEKKQGQGLGLYRMIFASSRVAGPAAGAVIYQQFGGSTVWSLCGIIGISCLCACRYYKSLGFTS